MLTVDSVGGFSRRDPFTFDFITERGSVYGRLCHPYLIQPLFKTKIVCERCHFVEFDEELRKKTDHSRNGETSKERKNERCSEHPSKSAATLSLGKFVCIHFGSWMWTWFWKMKRKNPYNRKTSRVAEFSVFSVASWCQETEWVCVLRFPKNKFAPGVCASHRQISGEKERRQINQSHFRRTISMVVSLLTLVSVYF